MSKNRHKRKLKKKNPPVRPVDAKKPFIEHFYELRHRLFYVVVSVGTVTFLAYLVQQQIVRILLRPAHGQQFIYTSPIGGVDFLFRVCIYTGIAFSIPVIIYQMLHYISPLIHEHVKRFIIIGSMVSGVLAIAGILFGYFIGLPAVLNFLTHQFVSQQIRPLVTIQSYMSFVMLYMLGSAMLFQIPLVIFFINKVTPIKPKQLFRYEKFVIAGSFIIAGLMNPTPNILSLLMVAGPLIMTYQLGIAIVWFVNRGHKRKRPQHVMALLEHDAEVQAGRLSQDVQTFRFNKKPSAPLTSPSQNTPQNSNQTAVIN